jgi:hypothetical protein
MIALGIMGVVVETCLFVGSSLLMLAIVWAWGGALVLKTVALAAGAESGALAVAVSVVAGVPERLLPGLLDFGPPQMAILALLVLAGGVVGEYRMAIRGFPMRLRFLSDFSGKERRTIDRKQRGLRKLAAEAKQRERERIEKGGIGFEVEPKTKKGRTDA